MQPMVIKERVDLLSEGLDGLAKDVRCPVGDAFDALSRPVDLHVTWCILPDEPEDERENSGEGGGEDMVGIDVRSGKA